MTARRLVILRHAKAEYRDDIADIDRPLTTRGHADAGAAGAWLATHAYVPDLVLCSPSKRTRQTWHAVALALADTAKQAQIAVKYDRAVYDGDVGELMRLIHNAGDAHTILLIGHNPSVSRLSSQLDTNGGLDTDGLRTSGIAIHDSDIDWKEWETAAMAASHTARG